MCFTDITGEFENSKDTQQTKLKLKGLKVKAKELKGHPLKR